MISMYKLLLLFLILGNVQAQDLRGKWIGGRSNGETVDYIDLKSLNDGVYNGESFDGKQDQSSFCHFTFKAKYDPENNVFLGKDDELIDKTNDHEGVVYRMKYSKEGNKEFLKGYARMVYPNGNLGGPIPVTYYKMNNEEKNIVKSYIKNRKNERKALIKVKNKEVKIRVHDYGKQDHDSISIIYNDEIIAYKIPINSEVKEYAIQVSSDKDSRITFIAHNLGDVAPNTAYVEILADDKVFKYTLFTNLSKNATIDLRLNN